MSFAVPLALALAFAAEEPAAAAASASVPDAGASTAAEEKKAAEKVRAVVRLRDGGLLRGTVRRMKLGKSITLALPSGKSITLDDEDVVTIELFGGAAPADAGAAEATAASAGAFPEQTVRPSARSEAAASKAASPAAAATRAASPTPAAAAPTRPPPQPAPAPELDTVYLADGGLLRGTIETEKPDLIIRLVSGRKRTVPAASVQRIDRRKKP